MRVQTETKNWNNFWQSNVNSRFTKKSWSKIRIMAQLDFFLKPDFSVLDAGSGSGFFSNYFLSKGCKVYSLDYSEDALSITRRLTSNRCAAYLKENLLDPQFGRRYKERFDLVFTDGLFEHFTQQDQLTILNNFREAKKAEGIIATFVPNKYSWWEVVRPLVMPGIHEEPFTRRTLLELHKGMNLIKTGGLNVLPTAVSPDHVFGANFGMILYCIAR